MPNAWQLPFSESKPTQVGRKTFRKHLLPVGSIHYDGRLLNFTRDRLARIAQNFREGAIHQVPLVLANDANKHNEDPERFRGEIKGLEVADDGLWGTVEMSDEGAKLLSDNPNLGVSPSILEEPMVRGDDGRTFSDVLVHVLGTFNPRITQLKGWQPVTLSNDITVIDLTAASFDDKKEGEMPEITEEDLAFLRKMREEAAAEPTEEDKAKAEAEAKAKAEAEAKPAADAAALDNLTEEQIAELIAAAEGEKETAGAGLSQEAQHAIDLANAAAEANAAELAGLQAQLAEERYAAEAKDMARSGIPPAAIELARPFLTGKGVVNLSNGGEADAGAAFRKLLHDHVKRVDLSGEIGTVLDGDASNMTRARELADQLKAQEKR